MNLWADWEKLEAHPIAKLFPLMSADDFGRLKTDIEKSEGLKEPIWLYEGKILDGRNRHRACVEIGVMPTFSTFRGVKPVAFVWSANGARRHLSPSELAAVAVKIMPACIEEETAWRASLNSGTPAKRRGRAARAAEIVGVSRDSVEKASVVSKADPELFAKVECGETTVNAAYKAVRSKNAPEPAKKASAMPARTGAHVFIEGMATTLEGCAMAIDLLEVDPAELTPAQAKGFIDALAEPMRQIATFIESIRAIAGGRAPGRNLPEPATQGEIHEAIQGCKAMMRKALISIRAGEGLKSHNQRTVAFEHFKKLLLASNMPALMNMTADEINELLRTI